MKEKKGGKSPSLPSKSNNPNKSNDKANSNKKDSDSRNNPEIVHLGNHVYERQYIKKEDRYDYVDITLEFFPKRKKTPGYTQIDLNKLTQPVLDIAIKEANKLKNKAKKKGNIQEINKLNHYSRKIEQMPVWRFPEDKELLLRWLAIRKLHINSEIGAKLIVDAYHTFYNLKTKCKQCKKGFIQKTKGRKKEFCSNSCKQKYYRRKKAGFIKEDKNGGGK
jgi:hypothetical protein